MENISCIILYQILIQYAEIIAISINVSLCVGESKGKAGIQLKSIPERDATEMYPRKVMHMIDG